MSNKRLLFAAGLALTFSNFATGQELAYTQNNPPRQHCATGTLSQENPILINAELLYGRVIPATEVFASNAIQPGGSVESILYNFDNKNKFGFRVGLGVGLGDNDANFSVQYMRQTSGEDRRINAEQSATSDWTVIFPYNFGGVTRLIAGGGGIANGTFTTTSDLSLRLQILDVVVQTAKWMATEMIRFQPFGGARYLNLRTYRSVDFTQNNVAAWGAATEKTNGYGAFIGTDIRFIVYNSFHFFTNVMVGILTGNERLSYRDEIPQLQQFPTMFAAKDRFELTLNPFWEVRFGMQWSHIFSNDVLLALRLSYEMLSLIHESMSPYRNTVIKTQLGAFGVTVAF